MVSLADPDTAYTDSDGLARLHSLVTAHVAVKLVPSLAPQEATVPSPAASAARGVPDWSRRSGPAPAYPQPSYPTPNAPFVGPGFAGGFPVGPSSLIDPLFVGGVSGGGLFVGPDSGLFGPGAVPPQFGPGTLPGARFDPFGPPGPDFMPGQGRGRGRTPFGL